jgi:hypothetical protein
MTRFLAILTVRNEAAFLLEWLAHHQEVGFTDYLVFSNNCQDGTSEMLDRLQELGHLTHVPNEGPYDKAGVQFTALKTASKHSAVKNADWIQVLDADEFVNIHAGDGTLNCLLGALPDADAVTLTWRLFGNGGILRYEDQPVTETFTRCAPEELHWPWRAAMFKTLYRNNGTYGKPGVHRPRSPRKGQLDGYRWFDCQGRELHGNYKTKRIFSDYGQPMYQLAQLNHYPLGAMESYILKADRGRANRTASPAGMDYWTERNFGTETDHSVLRYRSGREARQAGLLADGRLAELHGRAVEWRQQRFRQLMEEEPYRALFARLMMTPPARPLSAATARTLQGFAVLGRQRAAAADEG